MILKVSPTMLVIHLLIIFSIILCHVNCEASLIEANPFWPLPSALPPQTTTISIKDFHDHRMPNQRVTYIARDYILRKLDAHLFLAVLIKRHQEHKHQVQMDKHNIENSFEELFKFRKQLENQFPGHIFDILTFVEANNDGINDGGILAGKFSPKVAWLSFNVNFNTTVTSIIPSSDQSDIRKSSQNRTSFTYPSVQDILFIITMIETQKCEKTILKVKPLNHKSLPSSLLSRQSKLNYDFFRKYSSGTSMNDNEALWETIFQVTHAVFDQISNQTDRHQLNQLTDNARRLLGRLTVDDERNASVPQWNIVIPARSESVWTFQFKNMDYWAIWEYDNFMMGVRRLFFAWLSC